MIPEHGQPSPACPHRVQTAAGTCLQMIPPTGLHPVRRRPRIDIDEAADTPSHRHGPACPGHQSRHPAGIGGPDKPGHDGGERHRRRASAVSLRVIGLALALQLVRTGGAAAFPLLDPTNADQVPQGTELATPDAQDLEHQLQLVNGLAAPAGGGWTFVPRIDYQEMLTDNVEEQHSPRQADLVTYFAPGFSLAGDMPRLQMTLSYAPELAIYARTSSLDALTQQLNGLGTVTLAPDLAYVDVRAVSGVSSIYGGLGGLGTVGAPVGAGTTAQTATPVIAGNAAGLTRNNEVQTTSFAISPYLLHDFGDWGTGKLGYSLALTRSDTLSGFAALPYPSGGTNATTLLTNEVIGHFATGPVLEFLQNSIDVDISHGYTTTDLTGQTLLNGFTIVNPNGTVSQGVPSPPSHSTSDRAVVTDTVRYSVAQDLVLFASGGHEDITYSTQTVSNVGLAIGSGGVTPTYGYTTVPGTSIDDLTWSIGGTWTPGPDSSLTVSYGHANGFNSLTVNGYYQLTARTMVTATYGSTLGTELEYVQNQLNLAAANGTGALVNAQTGGSLFGNTNALAAQDGLFRTDTLTIGTNTALDRDIISFNLLLTKQTSSGTDVTATNSKTFNAAWVHQMRPDMTFSTALSLGFQDQTAGILNGAAPPNSTSIAASAAWQYQISETLSASLRYSFLARQSPVTAYSFYQNMLILGISKTF
jgi:hypothetical protein